MKPQESLQENGLPEIVNDPKANEEGNAELSVLVEAIKDGSVRPNLSEVVNINAAETDARELITQPVDPSSNQPVNE